MSLRQRLLAIFSLMVILVVGAVTWIVSVRVRDAYTAQQEQRTRTFVTQFRREFTRSGTDIAQRLERMASSEEAYRMGFELSHSGDPSLYLTEASSLAHAYGLDLLEIVGPDGKIVSSAQWPARFEYPEPAAAFANGQPFLKREDLPEAPPAIALYVVRTISGTDPPVLLAGGMKLDREFLAGLPTPTGMQISLYSNFSPDFNPAYLSGPAGTATNPSAWRPLIDQGRQSGHDVHAIVYPTALREESLDVSAAPLKDPQGTVIAVLLIANERRELAQMQRYIRNTAYSVAGVGILLAITVSLWIAARISRPIEHLARAVQQVAAGHWDSTVEIDSRDEIGQLAAGFNHMTAQLTEQRERLVQSERVAAWRELARRLAHELKNPLFPLQLTVENLVRSRQLPETEFNEVFQESTTTLAAELQNLKAIIGRFNDFSKMPKPQLQPEDLRESLRRLTSMYAPALQEKKIALKTVTPATPLMALADTELLHRALSNLVLNAMDAMPEGGTLSLAAKLRDGVIEIQIADTGSGLTHEECERLFTPYYTTKQHGTGLGLAVVQSIITDHMGTISVAATPGRGAEFVIELPALSKDTEV